MCFVTVTPRLADRKHAFVDAATGARVLSKIVGVLPRTRCGDMGRHCGGSRWGFFSVGVRKARLYCWPTLDGLLQPVTGPLIVERRKPFPEAGFDKFGIGGC